MEVIKHWDVGFDLVKTKKGALLYKITIAENHFLLEQKK